MTIKKRIVIWYTIWMAFLVLVTVAVLFSGSGALVRREAFGNLEEVVNDAIEDIRIRNGRILLDDVEFFDDGVYLSIWQNGALLDGRLPEDAPHDDFLDGVIQTLQGDGGTWYCLDIALDDGVFIRGVSRAYDMGTFASSVQILTLILLPLVVLLAALGGYLIVRRSFKPADKVIATAGDIADSEDLSKRIGLGDGKDEIHQMAAAFDGMMERIERAFEKEKQFTSDASHELRTPISVIVAESDYASSHIDDKEKVKEALDVISGQAGKMSRLVSELLTLARSDKGTIRINPEEFDLTELSEMVLATLEEKASEKNISLSLKARGNIRMEADQGMIARVIINLVSNSIKYGRDNGWSILRITEKDGKAIISVEDNGIGIGQEHLDKIWDRFYQVDSSRTALSSSGAGLGLSIVREIVLLHGGSVSVESVEGQGSLFTVELPLRQTV